ncbi:hypothetical protein LIER_01375 [Lithospermum erythrorhizon]|uniref:Reverse transcriptase domain-containing protein n=1 Tax=Lithospermum erythrorhizon TaxID=34254 RepID=A0AAV3NLW4_LITER
MYGALYNIVVKIISRIMTNLMRPILMDINSENQSAFLPGRMISDNILIAHEVLHFINHSKSVKNVNMPIKLDMSKAYDRVEWYFLEAIMLKMGFCRRWVDWIMCLVSKVSYSFLINGVPKGFVRPTMGIRQGDPLSPYLFLICAKGLSSMIREAELMKSLSGIKISRESPSISHILFVDDTIIFGKASRNEGAEIMRILKDYKEASDQNVNIGKCPLSFSPRTGQDTRHEILNIMGMREVKDQGKYLGLPLQVGRTKKEIFPLHSGQT